MLFPTRPGIFIRSKMGKEDLNSQGSLDPIRDLLDEKSLADEITKAIEGKDCPGDNELLAYLRKELDEPERIEVKSHLLFCSQCQQRTKELEREVPAEPPKKIKGKGFNLEVSFSLPSPRERRRMLRKGLVVVGISALVSALVYFLWIQATTDNSYGGHVVHAQNGPPLRVDQQLCYVIKAPEPVFLIEITIDGNGAINSRIPPGPRENGFSNGDRIFFTPQAEGDFDLYLVLCPVNKGFPNRILSGLLKFIKTENSLSRKNQRQGIEMALTLYQLEFVHEIYKIHP